MNIRTIRSDAVSKIKYKQEPEAMVVFRVGDLLNS